MKLLIIALLLTGFVMIAMGVVKSNQTCAPPMIRYRYLPKTFEEEQEIPVPLDSLFGRMFNDISPWQKTAGY